MRNAKRLKNTKKTEETDILGNLRAIFFLFFIVTAIVCIAGIIENAFPDIGKPNMIAVKNSAIGLLISIILIILIGKGDIIFEKIKKLCPWF